MKAFLRAHQYKELIDMQFEGTWENYHVFISRAAVEKLLRSATVKPPVHGSEEVVQVDLVMRGIL